MPAACPSLPKQRPPGPEAERCRPGCLADGTAWGALMLSSNGMDVVATTDKLTWRMTGGIIDLASRQQKRIFDACRV